MRDITSPRVIIIKGILFLFLGVFAATLLLLFAPDFRVALLLVIAIWAFCRAYYFAFYVIQKYVDENLQIFWVVRLHPVFAFALIEFKYRTVTQ